MVVGYSIFLIRVLDRRVAADAGATGRIRATIIIIIMGGYRVQVQPIMLDP
jgi:hypothetical protein